MTQINIGIIGAGFIAGVHSSILANHERTQVSLVHDVVDANAQRLAHNVGAEIAGSADEVIDRCDAVYITTPNTKHVELALAAIAAGKHVFCEKPMATNNGDALRVHAAAQKSNAVFQVGHNRRFAPVYATLKEMLSSTHTPHSAHIKMNRGELLKPVWTRDPNVTGGFLFETTIHMFDMVRFLFGEVSSLYAVGSKHEYNEVDDFSVVFRFASGLHATLASSSDASWLFPFERVEVFSHHATLVTREMESLTISTNLEGHYTEQSMQQLPREEKWGYKQEDLAFVDSIVNGTPPLVTSLDGVKSVELVETVYQAVRQDEDVPIKLN